MFYIIPSFSNSPMRYTKLENMNGYYEKVPSRCLLKFIFGLTIGCTVLFFLRTQSKFFEEIPYMKDQTDHSGMCKFPKVNPWDESVMSFFDPLYGYQAQCKKPVLRTKFEKGVLSTLDRNDHCWGSCLNRTSDRHHSKGPWTNSSETFKCDVVAVKCSKTPNMNDADYDWLHTQVYEKPEEKKKAALAGNHTYDVLVIVLDSTGSSHADRNIAKTLHYMTEGLNGVRFKYLNKVGQNSLPNAIPLFLGMIAEEVARDFYGKPSIKPNFDSEYYCSVNMDNLTSLQDEFASNGYVTSFFEDYMVGIYNYPNCIGYERDPALHTNAPFRQYLRENFAQLKGMTAKDACYTKHHAIFNHVEQFTNAYPGVPKFTTVWDTDLGHDGFMSSIEADTILLNLFIKNRFKLENSFIILMGDHGFRLGSAMNTKLGVLENNNPLLVVVPPKKLREKEKLMKTLRENSQKLQTHHDIHATLLDILKNQSSEGYSSQEPLRNNLIGSSFLRHQPGERSCRTLPIPMEYCICSFDQRLALNSTSELANDLGKFVTNGLNEKLKAWNISSICDKWKHKSMGKLQQLEPYNDVISYQVQVNLEPSAIIKGSVFEYSNGTRVLGFVYRGDGYGHRGDCSPRREQRPLCNCKQN